MRHIAHIRAAETAPRRALQIERADALILRPAPPEDLRQRGVGRQVAVARPVPRERHRRLCRFRRAAEAGRDALAHLVEQALPRGPHVELRRGPVGDDVRLLTAVLDYAVDPHIGLRLLAKQADRLIGQHQRVERVAPFPGRSRRVRIAAGELHRAGIDRQHRRAQQIPRTGVNHQRRADILKRARLDQPDFAAAALFRRRAEHPHAALDSGRIERRGCAQPRRRPGNRNQVVPAGVADLRQRVVLAEDADPRPLAAALRGERRLHPVGAAPHREAARFEKVGQRRVRVTLLVVLLRVRVNVQAQRAQRGRGVLDRFHCGSFGGGVAHVGSLAYSVNQPPSG